MSERSSSSAGEKEVQTYVACGHEWGVQIINNDRTEYERERTFGKAFVSVYTCFTNSGSVVATAHRMKNTLIHHKREALNKVRGLSNKSHTDTNIERVKAVPIRDGKRYHENLTQFPCCITISCPLGTGRSTRTSWQSTQYGV